MATQPAPVVISAFISSPNPHTYYLGNPSRQVANPPSTFQGGWTLTATGAFVPNAGSGITFSPYSTTTVWTVTTPATTTSDFAVLAFTSIPLLAAIIPAGQWFINFEGRYFGAQVVFIWAYMTVMSGSTNTPTNVIIPRQQSSSGFISGSGLSSVSAPFAGVASSLNAGDYLLLEMGGNVNVAEAAFELDYDFDPGNNTNQLQTTQQFFPFYFASGNDPSEILWDRRKQFP